jgi:hypothetical protein
MGVYFFQAKKAFYVKIAFFAVLFVMVALGLPDFYLSLLLIFLSSVVILLIPQDVLVI